MQIIDQKIQYWLQVAGGAAHTLLPWGARLPPLPLRHHREGGGGGGGGEVGGEEEQLAGGGQGGGEEGDQGGGDPLHPLLPQQFPQEEGENAEREREGRGQGGGGEEERRGRRGGGEEKAFNEWWCYVYDEE